MNDSEHNKADGFTKPPRALFLQFKRQPRWPPSRLLKRCRRYRSKNVVQVAANPHKFRRESEQKRAKRLAMFCYKLLLFSGLRRLRQDSANLDSRLEVSRVLRLGEKKWAEAQEALEKATQIDPNHARAFAALGMALCDQGKYDAAISPLEKPLQLDAAGGRERRWTLAKAYYQDQHTTKC